MSDYSFANILRMITFVLTGKTKTLDNQQLRFKQYANTTDAFASHYQHFIYPYIATYEQQRLSALKSFRLRCFISLLIIVGTNIALHFNIKQDPTSLLSIITRDANFVLSIEGIFILGLFAWCMLPIKNYKLRVKHEIYPNIFNYFENFTYSPTSDISLETLKPYGLFPFINYGVFTDSVTGIYKDVQVKVFVSELYCVTQAGDDTKRELLFRGICIVLSMNKKFSGHTIVVSRQNILDEFRQDILQFLSLQKVNLEDPIFNSKFLVYSNDQIEARYLLSTTFMERLLKLIELFNAPHIQCSFLENTLLITVPTKYDYFAVQSPFVPASFEDDINTVIDEMNHIIAIVDDLRLYQTNRL